jgi:hypothetical protein
MTGRCAAAWAMRPPLPPLPAGRPVAAGGFGKRARATPQGVLRLTPEPDFAPRESEERERLRAWGWGRGALAYGRGV